MTRSTQPLLLLLALLLLCSTTALTAQTIKITATTCRAT